MAYRDSLPTREHIKQNQKKSCFRCATNQCIGIRGHHETQKAIVQITDGLRKKYYNVIERASSEAAEECIGVPNEARAFTAAAFEGLSIEIETSWGPTPAVIPDRGHAQGSRRISEQSKPAQSLYSIYEQAVQLFTSRRRTTGIRNRVRGRHGALRQRHQRPCKNH